jgi:hypothetical protein
MGSGKNECGIIAVNLDGYISLQPCVAGAVAKTPLRWPSQVIESALSKLARSDVPKSDDFAKPHGGALGPHEYFNATTAQPRALLAELWNWY